ncbi:SAM-dependent methyltransferase [Synoicihabitans lomoniglobus]|uniref:Cyclopropane-fatty-acyl-phospholipid synthase n=1 Tax=Synoicihabitans lomoniglobus TaxID=2909285 RepID=A0AAE9ZVL2_9BACT|nr:cyclopropane-fatty-acyl-phospholipid synthase family protein [Opitutaceae bacterium LMO-M01]WED63954.1 cyclopropane-fatty-acyl-phospholipid synthase [Opitutaceae bacterium LMO-M01]
MIDALLERNLLPDFALRFGIRRLLGQRLAEEADYDAAAYVADLKTRGIAEQTAAANEQHYEVPTRFYKLCLGERLKYSGCYYPTGSETLDQAEEHMLDLYLERGEFVDGQDILELGCGWGSITLFLAARFPRSRITAVSNSRTQKAHIDAAATSRGLSNVTVITADMNAFDIAAASFDRVISIEMFEHMKNYQRLLSNVARWLRPGGKLFVHIFTHHRVSYHFVARDQTDWMARYFFTGGQMPAHNLLSHFQDDLKLEADWKVNGRHYQQTAEHWLQNMDANRATIMPLLVDTYGADQATKWWVYWRVFYLSCAELWGYRNGEEWLVSHYRFVKPA